MAFKRLNEEQLSELTDAQKKRYEEELFLYEERVKLVERLERYENLEIPPYEPSLRPIPTAAAPEEIRLTPVDYVVTKPEAVRIPDVSASVSEPEPVHAELPQIEIRTPQAHVPEFEKTQTALPLRKPLSVPEYHYSNSPLEMPPLPRKPAAAVVPGAAFTEPELGIEPLSAMPKVSAPELRLNRARLDAAETIRELPTVRVPQTAAAFTAPEVSLSALPKTERLTPERTTYAPPHRERVTLSAPKMPAVAGAETAFSAPATQVTLPRRTPAKRPDVRFVQPLPAAVTLPKQYVASVFKAEFKSPSFSPAAVSAGHAVTAPQVNVPAFDQHPAELPKQPAVAAPTAAFTGPERFTARLPRQPELPKVELPEELRRLLLPDDGKENKTV